METWTVKRNDAGVWLYYAGRIGRVPTWTASQEAAMLFESRLHAESMAVAHSGCVSSASHNPKAIQEREN
jgi:hypothetical protein